MITVKPGTVMRDQELLDHVKLMHKDRGLRGLAPSTLLMTPGVIEAVRNYHDRVHRTRLHKTHTHLTKQLKKKAKVVR